jgi:hypothetical protein
LGIRHRRRWQGPRLRRTAAGGLGLLGPVQGRPQRRLLVMALHQGQFEQRGHQAAALAGQCAVVGQVAGGEGPGRQLGVGGIQARRTGSRRTSGCSSRVWPGSDRHSAAKAWASAGCGASASTPIWAGL